jgi:hypothetical protein
MAGIRIPLPDSFCIQLLPQLSDAVLFLSIETNRNSVGIGPFITGKDSTVRVFRREIENAVDRAYTEFPMDYGAVRTDPGVMLKIVVESRDSLQSRLDRASPYWPSDDGKFRALLSRHGLLEKQIVGDAVVTRATEKVALVVFGPNIGQSTSSSMKIIKGARGARRKRAGDS